LAADQLDFVALVVEHLTANGAMDVGLLYEPPFTSLAAGGPETLFPDADVDVSTPTVRWLSHGYDDDQVVETVRLLDLAGLLGQDDLREAFEQADEDEERARELATLLVSHLGPAADIERLGVADRVKALRLSTGWQHHLMGRAEREGDWLTAAQVAMRYAVTPQAVYKWIKAGRVQAEQTPGGSWRLPAAQFARPDTSDLERAAALKARLLEHAGDCGAASDEALAQEIVDRRRA
jgi:hypothetical protein